MRIALLCIPLSLQEVQQLTQEFPQFLFLSYADNYRREITKNHWERVEIILSSTLTTEELSHTFALRWIHCPIPSLKKLCVTEIEKKGNILLTFTKEHNDEQVGEFVMGAVLGFAKNLFDWKNANRFPTIIWDAKWRKTMETLKDKIFLQIGMDSASREITRRAALEGMKVISIDETRSFHPYCNKNLPIDELPYVLPTADIVCVNLILQPEKKNWFKEKELELMKPNSSLIHLGSSDFLDNLNKIDAAQLEKLRGILIDAPYDTPISPNSIAWKIPNLIITPDVASRPKSNEREAFRLFRNNLRYYIRDNFLDMSYAVNTAHILEENETFS